MILRKFSIIRYMKLSVAMASPEATAFVRLQDAFLDGLALGGLHCTVNAAIGTGSGCCGTTT